MSMWNLQQSANSDIAIVGSDGAGRTSKLKGISPRGQMGYVYVAGVCGSLSCHHGLHLQRWLEERGRGGGGGGGFPAFTP